MLNPVLANLLDTADAELSEDFDGTLLLLNLKSIECVIDHTHVVLLNLFSLELILAIVFLLELLISPMLHLSFTVHGQVLLCCLHGIFGILNFQHLVVELAPNLLKDADTLLVGCRQILHFLENTSQFVSEDNQVFVNLGDHVEGDDLLGVVSNGHNEIESIALIEEAFNLVPFTVEVEHLLERGELNVGEEVLALLKDPDGQGLLNEWCVLLQVGHDLDRLAKCLATLLADLEG